MDGSIDVGVERRTAKSVIDRMAFRGISVLSEELGPAEAKSVPPTRTGMCGSYATQYSEHMCDTLPQGGAS
jgi:hypothetical protein